LVVSELARAVADGAPVHRGRRAGPADRAGACRRRRSIAPTRERGVRSALE